MKICFWGDIGRALQGKTSGGGELQIALLARALAKGGHEVVVVDYEATEDFITDDGIKIFKIEGWNGGIPLLRTFTNRLPRLYSSLKAQKADVYYCRIRDFRHFLAYRAARKVTARFVLGIASDFDIVDFRTRWKNMYLSNIRSMWGVFSGLLIEVVYPYLLSHSDYVFVQHEGQEKYLIGSGVKTYLFPNLIDLSQLPSVPDTLHKDFIYVGWLDKRKGIREFVELVKLSPQHSFKVIGPPRDKEGMLCYNELKNFNNVTLLGKQSHIDTLKHIACSKALVSTSPMEGFPNIFIEAWAYGIPVLSLYFDPGDVIRSKDLGVVADGKIDKLLSIINELAVTKEFSKRSKSYVEMTHELNNQKIEQIDKLFRELVSKT